MGRVSKELKEVKDKTKEKEWPVGNRDYHIVRVKRGEKGPANWLYKTQSRNYLDKDRIIYLMTQYKSKLRQAQPPTVDVFSGAWYLVPGPKPDKRWGPVCP